MDIDQEVQEFQKSPQKLKSQVRSLMEHLKDRIPPSLSIDDVGFSWNDLGSRTLARTTYRYSRKSGVCYNFHLKFHSCFKETVVPGETLIHELAHVLAMKWKGWEQSGHGFYWGYIMICLGLEPERLATRDTSKDFHEALQIASLPEFLFEHCLVCKTEQMFEREGTGYKCETCGSPQHLI